jgi:SAM-dependent methyltransferase
MNNTPSIEEVEKFWSSSPCNIRHSKKQIGTEEYFREVDRKKLMVEPHILRFSEFPKWKGKKVLEIGCGIGTTATLFVENGADYTGVELSKSSLDLTKKRFGVFDQKGQFYLGNAEVLSSFLAANKYDLVYSFGVIHHSPNPKAILREARKFMHKDSLLKVMIYAKHSWKNCMIENGFDQPEAVSGCPIAHTYTNQEANELFSDFEIISMEQDHIFPYRIPEYKNNEYKRQPWFEAMPDDMFKALEKHFGWHMLITAKLRDE